MACESLANSPRGARERQGHRKARTKYHISRHQHIHHYAPSILASWHPCCTRRKSSGRSASIKGKIIKCKTQVSIFVILLPSVCGCARRGLAIVHATQIEVENKPPKVLIYIICFFFSSARTRENSSHTFLGSSNVQTPSSRPHHVRANHVKATDAVTWPVNWPAKEGGCPTSCHPRTSDFAE